MTPPTSGRPSGTLMLFVYAAFTLIVMISLPVSALEPETCFSRQHQSAIVDVRLALNKQTTAMDARVVRTERDCVLACCSEEVKPGEQSEWGTWGQRLCFFKDMFKKNCV